MTFRITDEVDFDFLMKTDDDSFVDLRRVLVELSDPWIQTPGLWWWSTFMEYWRVPHEGDAIRVANHTC